MQGKTLRLFRRLHELTQRDLADAIGCTQGHIHQIEHGRASLTPEQAKLAARIFGVRSPDPEAVRPRTPIQPKARSREATDG